MTDAQQREAARQFFYKWRGKGKEDEDARSYWIDLLSNIFGVDNVTDRVQFEKKVAGDKSKKRIDVYIPETHVLIEQKSLGIPLDKPQVGHENKTPYQQAKEYDNLLPYDEKARWIIISNFGEIWIYDMSVMQPEPVKLTLPELSTKFHVLDFLVNRETKKITQEMEISLKAGEIVGELYDAFHKQYKNPNDPETLKSLNKLCVRLVFLLYGEDADVFGRKSIFHDYMAQFKPAQARKALRDLFRVLNQKPEERDEYLVDDDPILASFPYVNGGLFDGDDIEIPPFTDEIMDLLLNKASENFDWSGINGTIFGAVFESTLNPETRRSGGMHYTSIENIHKVIDPLFLDDLKQEFDDSKAIQVWKTKEKKLEAFQDKLASLSFMDPAAGSGNFLTETYTSLRKIENEVIKLLSRGQMTLGEVKNPIKVSIGQFAGIEINDFAVTVARTALWIAENQMMKETEDIVQMDLDFLPLKTTARIVEGNALRMDWESVVPREKLDYLYGNPPFVGASLMNSAQKQEAVNIFGKIKLSNSIDYVGAWYHLAARYIQGTQIKVAFVSTNSITQGEQVAPLWKKLVNEYGIEIKFAYQTFIWNSEASEKAHVHCVIIGFSCNHDSNHIILFSEGNQANEVSKISPYLIESENVLVESRSKPLFDVPAMVYGNKPTDDGNFILSEGERDEIIAQTPGIEQFIYPFAGASDYINGKKRYCFWLKNVSPTELRKYPEIIRRLNAIRDFRSKSSAEPTRRKAEVPNEFFFISQPSGTYILMPRHSSQRRRYIPFGFLDSTTIAADSCSIIPDAGLYEFGVLISNVHMSWMRTVAGRLKSDYRYSGSLVYNTFPWPSPTDAQRAAIEATAQGILDARSLYPDSSLADLYDPLTMPPELRKAHAKNDAAVMKAYGMPIKETDEAACVAWLMRLYQEKVGEVE